MPSISGTYGGVTGGGTSTGRSVRKPRKPRRPPQNNTYSGTSGLQGGGSITVDPNRNPPTAGNTPPPRRPMDDVDLGPYDELDTGRLPRPPGSPPATTPPPIGETGGGEPPPALDDLGYPLTPASAAARTGADEQLGITTGDVHQSLYRAALGYGDQGILQQYGDYGPVVDNPNSDLSTIARNEALQHTNLGNAMNAQNLFFSGTNQKGQTSVVNEAAKQRSDAYQRFKDAEQRLLTSLATAQAKKRDVYRTTGADDIAAALALPPQPIGTAEGDTPLPKPAGNKKPSGGDTKESSKSTKKGREITVSGTSSGQGTGQTSAVRGQGTVKKGGKKKGRSVRKGK
jgi:hypothetical protein